MHTFPAKARTANDGTLSLAIPTGLPDADVDVLVVFDVVSEPAANLPNAREAVHRWPAGYFEEYFGALRGEGLVRPSQGVIEERESLN
jgi:hypothetical protein